MTLTRSVARVTAVIGVFYALSCGNPSGPAAVGSMRVLSVHVVADEEFRRRPSWHEEAYNVVVRARELSRSALGLDLVIDEIGAWNSTAHAESLEELRLIAKHSVAESGSDLVLILCDQVRAIHHDPDSSYWGGASFYFDPWIIVRPSPRGEAWPFESEVVVHEIGHAFGLWHSAESWSVMRHCDEYAGDPAEGLDAISRAVMETTRAMDVRLGLTGLTDEMEMEITSTYLSVENVSVDHPVLRHCLLRALEISDQHGDEAESRALRRRAERLIRRGAVPRSSESRRAARRLRLSGF